MSNYVHILKAAQIVNTYARELVRYFPTKIFLLFCSDTGISFQVIVLGTPAEEEGGGKIDLIEAGAFKNLDVVFMAHPSQENAAYLPDVAEHE